MAHCSSCGATLSSAQRFCTQCGAPTGRTGLPTTPVTGSPGRGGSQALGQDTLVLYVVPPDRTDLAELVRTSAGDHVAEVILADEPRPVQARLRLLDEQCVSPRAVCLVGPTDQLPHATLDDDTGNDVALWTDNDFGMLSSPKEAQRYSALALPDVPVTRIPTDDPVLVARLLAVRDDLPATWRAGVAVTCATWAPASAEVARRIARGMPLEAMASPPLDAAEVGGHLAAAPLRLYFNVHGSDQSPDWFGEGGGAYPPALRAADVRVGPNAILVSEACYGARHDEGTNNISMAFFAAGGSAFVGSTIIAWGPATPPLSLADLVVTGTYEGLDAGLTLGEALLAAKARIVEAAEQGGGLAPQDLNTISSFVALGGPLARVAGASSPTRRAGRGIGTWAKVSAPGTRGPGDVLGRVRSGIRQGGGGPLGAARQRLAERAARGGWKPVAREVLATQALPSRFRTAGAIQAALAQTLGTTPTNLNAVTYSRGVRVETLLVASIARNGFTQLAAVVVDSLGTVRARLVARGWEGSS